MTISGLNVEAEGMPAIYVEAGATLNLTVEGENSLTGGAGFAGICVEPAYDAGWNYDADASAKLYISGSGTLTATGGDGDDALGTYGGGAGIGGNGEDQLGGDAVDFELVNITSDFAGTLNACGGASSYYVGGENCFGGGAGIGGGGFNMGYINNYEDVSHYYWGEVYGAIEIHGGVMNELYRHIGQFVDIPAGDIGVGAREVGYLFGQYKRIMGTFEGGTITGKGIPFGGSLARTQATGYGLCYFAEEAMRCMKNDGFAGKTVVVSGSGNVATYAAEKCTQLGGKVVAMCDSNGYVYDPNGINLAKIIDIKQKRRARIKVYADEVPGSEYHEGCHGIWNVKCDIALPCATQNEMDLEGAKTLIANGCMGVFEGANMPLTPDAIAAVQGAGLMYSPGKASNAGGVATSGLEMTQNSIRLSWSFEEVDEKLQGIMKNIFHAAYDASVEVGKPGDLMVGANVAGFLKVAAAMMAEGVV